ncbi:phosphoenolpyruvate carboxykinase (ATP) [Desulfuribacillus alkaliarsenatis]|uniref:Phosphoenolpyruvate carboxykinase (ATP) n=1 Tax=Desulfuribacillus alkaliarsenatis TaxID=766136 RepID=A0A1E5G0F7_9FIRM|nr:phosphoenolpyruvate carboxykinase (ATP) [Desulfuribacillus alkaliarsenatis]OEF96189.1 phosphoenolpyruvate carboxykinase (ATP) [Desulfuribacillus alkaliarsenatis]
MSKPEDITKILVNSELAQKNLPVPQLVEKALANGEGVLTDTGAFRTTTGKYTGRSPNDKFIVDEPSVHDKINWGPINKPFSPEKFNLLYNKVLDYLKAKELYIFEGFGGKEKTYQLPIRVINEFAWHNLFIRQLLCRPTAEELDSFEPEFTILSAPGFKADPEVDGTNSEAFIIVNFAEKVVLIGGTQYAGEMKKTVFSILNYLLPQQGVLPMHCSANKGQELDVALFFGLSGTGKTTLSADPNRYLIGDDEHGWTDDGIFNFEGGCYAKCIKLSRETEPQIWDAIKFGAVLENVVIDDNKTPDYDSSELTENTRAGYPVDYIPNAILAGTGGHPNVVVFLTADAFGVLPPVAKLTKEQAMYHFLSGYTSKLAGTERGITEPQATFSTCFGAPFLPLPPVVYAKMLGEKIEKHNTSVYLVNTGWSGGPYGVGKRMNLPYTRNMVSSIIDGTLDNVDTITDDVFGLQIPISCPGVPDEVLVPRNTWQNKDEYDQQANDLAARFQENFKKFSDMPDAIKQAGPKVKATS